MAARYAAWRPPVLERVEGWQAHVDSSLMKDLTNRGCRIPQVPGVSKRHDVIQVEFAKSKPARLDVRVCAKKTLRLFSSIGIGRRGIRLNLHGSMRPFPRRKTATTVSCGL